MIFDHVGLFFFPEQDIYRFVGRFSFPLFFFLIGYMYSGIRTDKPAASSEKKWVRFYATLPAFLRVVVDFFWSFNIKIDLLLCLLAITLTNLFIDQAFLPLNILFTVIVCRISLYLLEQYDLLKHWLLLSGFMLALVNYPTMWSFDYGSAAILLSVFGYLVKQHRLGMWKPRIFLVLTYLTYCGFQMLFFPAELIFIIPLYVGIAVLFTLLARYQFQARFLLPQLTPVNYVVMFISRYSLFVYSFHYLVFKISSSFMQIPGPV